MSLSLWIYSHLESLIYSILSSTKSNEAKNYTIPYTSCLLKNISQCDLTETARNFVISIYNPLSRVIDYYVRVPVTKGQYTVLSPDGK